MPCPALNCYSADLWIRNFNHVMIVMLQCLKFCWLLFPLNSCQWHRSLILMFLVLCLMPQKCFACFPLESYRHFFSLAFVWQWRSQLVYYLLDEWLIFLSVRYVCRCHQKGTKSGVSQFLIKWIYITHVCLDFFHCEYMYYVNNDCSEVEWKAGLSGTSRNPWCCSYLCCAIQTSHL